MKTIMVATDFSERSDRALRRATLLAKQSGASVSLVNVVDNDQPRWIVESERDIAAKLLREQANTIREVDGVACDVQVVLADPFAGILDVAEDAAPDLLVLGPHRRRVLRDVFVGTTAERTIRSVKCPTLMANAPPVAPYRNVLVTTDLSESSQHAERLFTRLDLAPRARVSVLHVFDVPELRLVMSHTMGEEGKKKLLEEARGNADRALSAFIRNLDGHWSRQMSRQNKTSAGDEILAAAKELSADLIVVATHRTGLARRFLGSVAEQVLRSSECDVLAIPPDRRG